MSEAKDPAIKLFGKTIQLPEIVAPVVDSGGVNPSSSAEAPLHDGPPSEDRPSSPNSSTEEHNSDGVGEEQEAEKVWFGLIVFSYKNDPFLQTWKGIMGRS